MSKKEKYSHLLVQVHQNGTVRIYGNGGMIYEATGEYLKLDITVDPLDSSPSGTVPPSKKKGA